MAIISPGTAPGEFQAVGQQLLALAKDRRRDVKLVNEGPAGNSFEVPDELYERWMRTHSPDHPVETQEEEAVTPVKRGPGRPRKNPLPEQE